MMNGSGYYLERVSVRKNLDEVSLMRPMLIILLVLYHSLAIYTGNWELPKGVQFIPSYMALGKLAYAFMLESFVFISGYVWAFQCKTKGGVNSFAKLIINKGKRLLIPTVIWGLIYVLLFERETLSIEYILVGPGHLWFLPMLFECFVISWCALVTKLPYWVLLPFFFIIALLSPTGMPFNLSYCLYYSFFFLLGYFTIELYSFFKRAIKGYYLVAGWLLFLFSFFSMVLLRAWVSDHIGNALLMRGGQNLCHIIYSSIGTYMFFITSVYFTEKHTLPGWIIKIGALCMGAYIFQQFILHWLYYYTLLPYIVNAYMLPWITFFIALIGSISLAYIIRLNRIGKQLL